MKVSGITYAYDEGRMALENVNMVVEACECVAILGPNGAGKSTLLKIMAGLLKPTSGMVEVMGQKLTGKSANEPIKSIGILFQDPDDQLFMPRVWDDVAFGPMNQGMTGSELEKRVNDALRIAGIEELAERVPHHLSYGEKKRVAIAGILAMKPKILLLDEPTANLDPRGRKQLMDLLGTLGCTIIIATHDMEAAAAMADSIYILNRKVLAQGSKREVLCNGELLKKAGLEMPTIAQVFSELKKKGRYSGEIPLTVEEAMPNERKKT